MENKIQKEEFDSTEVKIQAVESDISDGWEFMSKHEAEMESVPHLCVPKMHEQIEKCDSTSRGIGISSVRRREQEIFSYQVQEKEHDIVQKEMEEAMQENFQREEENERVRREMVEAMQDLHQDCEKDRLKRELHELKRTVREKEEEKNTLRRELRELKQTVHQNELEKDGLRKELHELRDTVHQNELKKVWFEGEIDKLWQIVQEKEQEKNELKRELSELKQTEKPELEKDSGRKELYELGQTMPQNEKGKEIDRLRREKELHEAKLDVLQNEQESNIDKRKTDESMQDKESAFRAADSSESEIHAVEGESSAKGIDEGKTKVLLDQFNVACRQDFILNRTAKVVIPAKKPDNLEERKYVELTSD